MKTSFINKSNRIDGTLFKFIFVTTLFLCVFAFSVNAQENTNSNSDSSPTPTATETPEPTPTPIPLSSVITQAEKTAKKLQEIEKKISDETSIENINQELPKLTKALDAKEEETARPLAARASLETLDRIEKEWRTLLGNIPTWKSTLQTQATEIDKQGEELKKIALIWQETLNTIDESKLATENPTVEIPAEITEKIKDTVTAIKKTQTKVGEKRADLLTLQARISEQEKRINDVLEKIKNAREMALSHLFVKDSPAIWYLQASPANSMQEVRNSFSAQLQSLREYADQQSERFLIHIGILFLLIFGLYRAKPRVHPLVEEEPRLMRAMTVFEMPIASALILTIIFSRWFYPQAPGILGALLGAAALIPGIILLRRLIEKPVFPFLNALVVFYFVDRLRELTDSLPIVSRILFLAEMLGAIIFLVWLLRSKRLTKKIEVQHFRTAAIIKKIIPFGLFFFAISFITNIFGYVSLSHIIGNGILASAYAALILYAAVQIIESLLVFAFRVRPLSTLGMVKTHRHLIQHRVFQILLWIAIITWVIFTLNFLSLRETIFGFVKETLMAELTIGSLSLSLIDVLAFCFTVWVAFLLSRLIRFVLEEDVYPRVDLAGGIPYAISTILHYVLLLLGFFVAIAALGIDLTKFTILAGAFGVGLGFGLQNIVNNFVSGLILLFERPVKVGDMIQMGDRQGDLKQIGLRASVMRTLEGAEVIVPNGHLISEEVTNWTLSDSRRRLDIPVGVKYGTDPEKVIELLEEVAKKHPEVVKEPLPRTLFLGFGDNSLNFQFRAWTLSHDQWQIVKSELAVGIYKTLNEANIEIPFPQRDLHLKSVDKNEFEKILPTQREKDQKAE